MNALHVLTKQRSFLYTLNNVTAIHNYTVISPKYANNHVCRSTYLG